MKLKGFCYDLWLFLQDWRGYQSQYCSTSYTLPGRKQRKISPNRSRSLTLNMLCGFHFIFAFFSFSSPCLGNCNLQPFPATLNQRYRLLLLLLMPLQQSHDGDLGAQSNAVIPAPSGTAHQLVWAATERQRPCARGVQSSYRDLYT